ncbi:MAG: serine/threonine protein kinase [Rhizonema sp. PD38]|nr:serine/threonine protein kinase [Rhizonema sp. PD38]
MICCLNPDCLNPLNPKGRKMCQSCTTPLVQLLRDRFSVTGVLSDEGGFGRTYVAEDVDKLNERCVIKQLAPKFQGDWAQQKAMELFQKEAQRLQQLGEHPRIPTLHAYFEQDNYLYLVQQFIDGQNLLKELQQKKAYSSNEIQEILRDLLPILKFIHECNVIHRDIKPQNIIRRRVNKASSAKSSYFSSKSEASGDLVLIDFGSSKQLTAKVQVKPGTTIGSHGYSPIEQIRDGTAYPASDLFSLGATCFHLLTGVSPFELWTENGYSWVEDWQQYLRSPVSGELAHVLNKLLKKDIYQRYQSADEAIADLNQQIPQTSRLSSVTENVVIPPTQQPSLPKYYPKLRILLLVSSALLLLGSGEFWYRQFHHSQIPVSFIQSQSDNAPVDKQTIQSQPSKISLQKFFLTNTLKAHSNSMLSLAISSDSKTIVSNSDNTIKLWSVATGQEISTLNGHTDRVNVLAISPDGATLVSGSDDKTVKLWNLATGQEIGSLEGHSNSVHALAFSRDGAMLADGSDDNTIKVWNLTTGRLLYTLAGHSSWVRSVIFSPNSKTLISSSFDRTIKVWNLATGRPIFTLTGHSKPVPTVAISPNGKILASGSFDRTIKLWNMDTGQQIHTLVGHSNAVATVAISPDGKTLASGGFDKTIKLWNLATGQQIRTLTANSDAVQSIAFSQDGTTLVSGSEDNTIKIWRIAR